MKSKEKGGRGGKYHEQGVWVTNVTCMYSVLYSVRNIRQNKDFT